MEACLGRVSLFRVSISRASKSGIVPMFAAKAIGPAKAKYG